MQTPRNNAGPQNMLSFRQSTVIKQENALNGLLKVVPKMAEITVYHVEKNVAIDSPINKALT